MDSAPTGALFVAVLIFQRVCYARGTRDSRQVEAVDMADEGVQQMPAPTSLDDLFRRLGRSPGSGDGVNTPLDVREANLAGVDLSVLHLLVVDFRGARLAGADFSRVSLSGSDFRGADLRQALFVGADVSDAHFDNADLTGATFAHADVSGACFDGATMTQAILDHADASYATFTGTNLSGASLHSADVSAADLADALTDAQTVLVNITTDAQTRLP
jgi:uncharacterized protein YjbI with pentapeptide repeats